MVAMATPTGFEPVTSAVTGQRSSQLNYGAKFKSMGGNFILSALFRNSSGNCTH